jgi:hypothetical protein
MTGNTEVLGIGELRQRKQLRKNFAGTSLMGDYPRVCGTGPKCHHLDCKCADVNTCIGHSVSASVDQATKYRMRPAVENRIRTNRRANELYA